MTSETGATSAKKTSARKPAATAAEAPAKKAAKTTKAAAAKPAAPEAVETAAATKAPAKRAAKKAPAAAQTAVSAEPTPVVELGLESENVVIDLRERVAVSAYLRWESGMGGDEIENWLEAERELLGK